MPSVVINGNSNTDDREPASTLVEAKLFFQRAYKEVAKEPVAKQAFVGGATGWVVGYLSMKVGKAAATVVGGGLIIMQLAAHKGYIQIDWRKVNRDLEKNAKKLQKQVESQISGNKGKDANRHYQQAAKALDKLERELTRSSSFWSGRVQNFFSDSHRWLERQYRQHLGTEEQQTLRSLYALNVYLLSFWAGTVLGSATGKYL